MSRIVRIAALGCGLVGGVVASQAPEFAQQYRQRLGGGDRRADARRRAVRRRCAGRAGESRDDAIARLRGNGDDLASRQGTAMAANAERLSRLEEHRRGMAAAGPFARIGLMARDGDTDVLGAAYRGFRAGDAGDERGPALGGHRLRPRLGEQCFSPPASSAACCGRASRRRESVTADPEAARTPPPTEEAPIALADPEGKVKTHYGTGIDEESILAALRNAGIDPDKLSAADFAPIDEFHLGWKPQTLAFAQELAFTPDMTILDVGCGIGGPARTFAEARGCRVAGIDLTPEFVAIAEALTRRCKLDELASFRVASALDLPFDDDIFDGAIQFHVGMNIADKAGAFSEVFRVLRAGGTFGVYDVVRTAPGDLPYPVPWAASAETSFVETAETYRRLLGGAGFRIDAERNRRDFCHGSCARGTRRPSRSTGRRSSACTSSWARPARSRSSTSCAPSATASSPPSSSSPACPSRGAVVRSRTAARSSNWHAPRHCEAALRRHDEGDRR